MGPSQAGRSTDHGKLASGFSAMGPSPAGRATAHATAHGKGKEVKVEDEELYSDPDEGVEIVDMDQIQKMDWMAPDILRKVRRSNNAKTKQEGLDHIGMPLHSLLLCTISLSGAFNRRSRGPE